ncbi:hypothetical protein BZL29_7838 [Mycobacterium kansasii]|uniref:Uncharacterized protein n=1 Tax=Mycobacterium kansasii TaxID=1768 RepID=A0A1V3WE65_MYCKA|nr:hypothetical protein BZL29_7838 [Mycobacterium kansasii]
MSSSPEKLIADGVRLPERMPALPPARDFLVSGGFGGAAALVAALIVALVAVVALRQAGKRFRLQSEQRERHHQELRDDERHAAAVKECRERLAWVVDKGSMEPAAAADATVGFGPELALTVLQGLLKQARELDDATLATASAVQLKQFSRVLAQQGSALLAAAEAAAPAAGADPDELPASKPDQPAAEVAAGESPAAANQQVSTGGRRRRR